MYLLGGFERPLERLDEDPWGRTGGLPTSRRGSLAPLGLRVDVAQDLSVVEQQRLKDAAKQRRNV